MKCGSRYYQGTPLSVPFFPKFLISNFIYRNQNNILEQRFWNNIFLCFILKISGDIHDVIYMIVFHLKINMKYHVVFQKTLKMQISDTAVTVKTQICINFKKLYQSYQISMINLDKSEQNSQFDSSKYFSGSFKKFKDFTT